MSSLLSVLENKLKQRLAKNQLRHRPVVESAQGAQLRIAGQTYLNFSSNDYLGLANHPRVVAALQKSAGSYGVGAGASHLVSGHSCEHHALEEALAAFTGRESALLFSTGYMANLGVIATLLSRRDFLLQDKLNHASLLDAAQLSGAQWKRFRHNDIANATVLLQKSEAKQKMLAVDAVYSMDGDLAPLDQLVALCQQHQTWLMIDDAHGFGVLGNQGRGSCSHWHLGEAQVPIYMATLGKAIGTFGAFVAGPAALIESLKQFARSYVYTTAMPPAVAAATRASLAVLQQEPEHLAQLHQNIAYFKQLASDLPCSLLPSESAIQPLVLGSEEATLAVADHMKDLGFWVGAIRPPTVPVGQSRLRLTISAQHTAEQIERLVFALQKTLSSPAVNLLASRDAQS